MLYSNLLTSIAAVMVLVVLAVGVVWSFRQERQGDVQASMRGIYFPLKSGIAGLRLSLFWIPLMLGFDALKPYASLWLRLPAFAVGLLFAQLLLSRSIEMTRQGIIAPGYLWQRTRPFISFAAVAKIENLENGGTRVTGTNGVVITHTRWHVSAERFREELQARANNPIGPALMIDPIPMESVEAH